MFKYINVIKYLTIEQCLNKIYIETLYFKLKPHIHLNKIIVAYLMLKYFSLNNNNKTKNLFDRREDFCSRTCRTPLKEALLKMHRKSTDVTAIQICRFYKILELNNDLDF